MRNNSLLYGHIIEILFDFIEIEANKHLEGHTVKLDRIDRRILQAMQANARISNLELAEAVGLSPTPCSRRVKRLEESGIIRAHVTLLNQSMLGLKLTAYIGISMDRHTPDRFEAFEQEVTGYPEVMDCSVVTGQSSDYLLKAVVPDMQYYEKFLLGKLTRIPGVAGVHSSFELRRVVQRTELPLDHISDKSELS
jgi:Lrp/AsnC family leucine-responsive transcriptional regulator